MAEIRERDIDQYLVSRVHTLGGEARKVRWEGRNHAPDRFVMLNGRSFFAELKAPGKKARPGQLREHERMRIAGGVEVVVLDGYEAVDQAIREARR